MPIQKLDFIKGMDKDSDVRYLQPGTYRDAENVRITNYEGGVKFSVSNMKGNTEISYTLPLGNNTVIGSFDDKQGQAVYYFVYNSATNHSVLKYDYKLGVVTKILQGSGFNFSLDYYITSVALLDNKFLIFTDNYNEPRWIDLTDLLKYLDSLSNLFIVDGTTLDIAKAPEVSPPYVSYNSNAQKLYNNLNGKLWQFRAVYEYRDKTTSVFSTISVMAKPAIDSQLPFLENQDISIENEIIVTIPHLPRGISKVRIYSQGNSNDSEKGSSWSLIKEATAYEVNVTSAPSAQYGVDYADFPFANDGIYTSADPLDVVQAQTYVPKKSQTVDLIYGNRLALANNTEGFDVDINLDATLSFSRQTQPSVGAPGLTFSYNRVPVIVPGLGGVNNPNFNISITGQTSQNGVTVDKGYATITLGGTPKVSDRLQFSLTMNYQPFSETGSPLTSTSEIKNYSIIVSQSDIDVDNNITLSNLSSKLALAINSVDSRDGSIGGIVALPYSGATIHIYEGQNTWFWETPTSIVTAVTTTALSGTAIITNLGSIETLPSYKKNALHEFGIEYSDNKGRRSTVITGGGLNKVAPTWGRPVTSNGRITSTISIQSLPPSWATSYAIMYTKNNTYESVLDFVGVLADEGNNLWSVSLQDLYRFRISNLGTPISYTFSEGDSIQFLQSVGGTQVFDNVNPIVISSESGLTTERKIYFNFNNTGGFLTPMDSIEGTGGRYLFQITRPKRTQEDKLYYEIGHNYPVTSGFHMGNQQNQTASQSAIIDLSDSGDIYFKQRYFVGFTYPAPDGATVETITVLASEQLVEEFNFSDYYNSKVTNIGRTSVINDNARELVRGTQVVYSQPYIPETEINGISTVYDTSLKQYSTQYGSIQKIHADGRDLKVFQESRNGTVGIQRQLVLTGTQQTYETQTVLTPINYTDAEYGIGLNPESLSVYGYREYIADTFRTSILRISRDGYTEISSKSLQGFWTEDLNKREKQRVRIVWNKNFNEVVVSSSSGQWVLNPSGAIGAESATITIPVSDYPVINVGDIFSVNIRFNTLEAPTVITYYKRDATVTNVNGELITLTYTNVPGGVGTPSYFMESLIKSNYNVLTFNEESGAWISKVSFKPEWMEEAGSGMVSFKDGKVYLHDDNETRGEFYGTTYPATITVIANEQGSNPKTFRDIQVESNSKWNNGTDGDISTPEGSITFMTDNNYKKLNNQFFAPILRDTTTPNVTNPRFEGRALTSSSLKAKFTNSDTTQVTLFSVGFGYFLANLSNFNG